MVRHLVILFHERVCYPALSEAYNDDEDDDFTTLHSPGIYSPGYTDGVHDERVSFESYLEPPLVLLARCLSSRWLSSLRRADASHFRLRTRSKVRLSTPSRGIEDVSSCVRYECTISRGEKGTEKDPPRGNFSAKTRVRTFEAAIQSNLPLAFPMTQPVHLYSSTSHLSRETRSPTR